MHQGIIYIPRYTYTCMYVCTCHTKKLCKSFLEMPKLTKQVSNLINSSLNMGISKFSKPIQLQNRDIPSLFFLPSLSQIPLKKNFTTDSLQAYISALCWELGRSQALCCDPLLPQWRYPCICKAIQWQLPSTCPCFLVGSMTAPHFLDNQKDQEQENKWCPRFGEELQVVPK